MTEQNTIELAKQAILSILNALNVIRVVCVDDIYETEIPVEEIIGAVSGLSKETIQEFLPEIGGDVPDDQELVSQKIRTLWQGFNLNVRNERAEKILAAARLQDGAGTDDPGDAALLSELIPESMFQALSPRQWEDSREALLMENRTSRILFLFDQELAKDGSNPLGGIKAIASLLVPGNGNIICGLLTHTVTPENHDEMWSALSRDNNIPRDQFLVVPKLHLSKDPLFFAHILKLITLSPKLALLKQKARAILTSRLKTPQNKSKVSAFTTLIISYFGFQRLRDYGSLICYFGFMHYSTV